MRIWLLRQQSRTIAEPQDLALKSSISFVKEKAEVIRIQFGTKAGH